MTAQESPPPAAASDADSGGSRRVLDDDQRRRHDDLLLRVAERHYFGHRSLVAIAEEFGISRFRVARLIAEADRRGAVRISLHRPSDDQDELAVRLRAKFGLRNVALVDATGLSEEEMRRELGIEGARVLSSLLVDGDVLGVGWGRAIESVADALVALPRCPVVQLSGITGHPSNNSMELVRRFSVLTGQAAYPLYAPLILPTPETAGILKKSDGIADTLSRFRDVSVAVVAIGSWNPPNSLLRSHVSPAVADILTAAGLQTEIGGILLDVNGAEISTPFTDQILSISASQLAAIPTVLAVAGHLSKLKAIRAALIGGSVNALVTDTEVAAALLE